MADHETIFKLAAAAVTGLKAGGKMIATAESCTGGWIAKAITDVSGSSAVFAYGVVSYSNGAKESLLGVSSETLQAHGAVSEQTVCEMAEGVMNMSGADLAVAVSGIAGPDGGTPEKPVGTVWFAWAARDGSGIRLTASRQQFPGDREHIRELSVACALQGVIDRVRKP